MHRSVRALALALVPLLAACAGAASPGQAPAAASARVPVSDARSLVAAMHARYSGSWYRTLSFKQNVIRTNPDGTRRPTEVWTEYAQIPGRLRIDFGNGYSGNGAMYVGDSLYVFREGALSRTVKDRNPLMLMGFDVYGQAPERTLEMLSQEGFDLGRFHRTTWQDRPVYVLGAAEGDLRSPQFWIDAERLLFVRLLQPAAQDSTRITDIRFNRYEPLAGGWIAPEVVFVEGGREVMREEYFDVVANPQLPAGLFEPGRWGPVGGR